MGSLRAVQGKNNLRERFDEYRSRARQIDGLVGTGTMTSDDEVAALIGITRSQVVVARHLLVGIDALEWRGGQGRAQNSWWKMLKTGPELDAALDMEMERQMRGGLSPETEVAQQHAAKRSPVTRQSAERPAVQSDRLGFAVGAVIGPDAPKPLVQPLTAAQNGPAALVFAAKQYRDGVRSGDQQKALALVKELNDMGISVPPELAAKAAPKKDARLDAIALVLPYVEDIERRLVRAEDALRQQADYGTLRQTVDRQKHQIERLVAQRVGEALTERPNRT